MAAFPENHQVRFGLGAGGRYVIVHSYTTPVTAEFFVVYRQSTGTLNSSSVPLVEAAAPGPAESAREKRRVWTREAIAAQAVDLRRHPPEVIERPKQRLSFKPRTRSLATRWRVLQ